MHRSAQTHFILFRILCIAWLCLLLFILTCTDSTKSEPGFDVSLVNPAQLSQNTDSIEVVLSYGKEAFVIYQGTREDPGFEGPYETTLMDYTEENVVLRIYAFDAHDSLLPIQLGKEPTALA